MLLSKPDLIARINAGLKNPKDHKSLSFSPQVSLEKLSETQCSIDLRLAPIFTVFKQEHHVGSYDIQSAKDIFEAENLWEHHPQDRWTLEPKQFVLTQTLETVHLPNDLMGLVEGRSSFARFGVGVHVTAPKIDPGFNQPITLELTNHSEAAWVLKAGEEGIFICQLMLVKLSKPLRKSEIYGSSPADLFVSHATPIPGKKKK
ncbi:MAG: dCTP deaminase [Candidatus Binataceae bacterium]